MTSSRQRRAHDDARRYIAALSPSCTAPSGFSVTRKAWDIQDQAGFNWWDCLLLASAILAGCRLFVSEDMQHGRTLDALTIVSPFMPDGREGFTF
jgi:predicted nucleic acid-binding protein